MSKKTKGQRKSESKKAQRNKEKDIDDNSAPKKEIMQGKAMRRKFGMGLAKGDKK